MAFTELDSWLSARSASDQFSGVVLVRSGDETPFAGAYGWASRRWPVPNTLATRFDTASITKLFTAVAALRLVDEGRLDLDAPITGLVDLSGTTISSEVTVRHLLTHTSGIGDDADEEAGESYEALWVDKPVYSVVETRDHLPNFVHKPPNFPPGKGCRYCNVGYVLVGLAIEEITGTAYRDHVRETVFARAGMSGSDFHDRREAVPDVAEGWDPVEDADGRITGWRQNIFSYPPIGSPDGGAHATAEDLVRFLRALRGGELLSPERTGLFLTPQVPHHRDDDGDVWYGFGLEFTLNPDGSVRNYYKDGGNAGVSGIARYYPAEDLDVVVLSNAQRGGLAVIREVDRRIRIS
ncbi:CubicO group peptidase (beta-lactamase class C family) [Saccharothrix tamanrassetensis]|uniref:CubicO group peptidase (Beta-lactamase class C family) n=1 Tax=Saccharothrix tamanrassetensis TaxID=1051531 RepID=A0A841CRK3_9PSEU|nr:serine hydrolase domain-containing protein [Saccharothrix tamanrassetensis]MBB5958116.1 CubicO group peptidase (beta-lactamase class C family) [Saccharothrix tamanrassetensis]